MAITYSLAPLPKWVMINNEGTTAGGAKLYTYSSLDKTQPKAVYQDQAGSIEYTNPIIFDANGTRGPFYWKVDSTATDDTYYLEAYDSDDNLLWTLDDFFPPGGSGGGTATTYLPLINLIANSVFLDHIDDTAKPINSTNLFLAPSNHHGFTPDTDDPVIGLYGALGPDIRFVKNNTTADDKIFFVPFLPGDDPFTDDVTPTEYVRYQCTAAGTGETYKSFQFPINHDVNALDNQILSCTLWARVAATPVDISVYLRQFFGTPTSGETPSADVLSTPEVISLTNAWTKYTFQITVPNTAAKTFSSCGDDALYLQIWMPLGAECDVYFAKPSLYIGNINPNKEFQTYDYIDSVIQTPRTSDVKTSFRASMPGGWISMNNQSIGSATSGATNRANIDTFFLYKTLWDGVTNAYAPVATGRGSTAQDDFVANKALTLTRALGRVLSGANSAFTDSMTFTANATTDLLTVASTANLYTGTPVMFSNTGGGLPAPLAANTVYYLINISSTTLKVAISVDYAEAGTAIDITTAGTGTHSLNPVLGVYLGEGAHVLIAAEEAPHTHPSSDGSAFIAATAGTYVLSGGNDIRFHDIGSTGLNTGGQPHNTIQPTLMMNVFIKL